MYQENILERYVEILTEYYCLSMIYQHCYPICNTHFVDIANRDLKYKVTILFSALTRMFPKPTVPLT